MSPRLPHDATGSSRGARPTSVALVVALASLISWHAKGTAHGPHFERAQTRSSPERPRRVSGTASVRGQVLDAQNGAPLRRAEVRASLVESGESWVISTDANGRYELSQLPAGRFNIGATKDGYVGLQIGQRWPHDQATTIRLDEHQQLERVDHRLSRAGVIVGHVVDEFADPQADVLVMALESRLANGRRVGVPAGRSSTTNDLGEFRVSGLIPGRYYVTARHHGAADGIPSESKARSGYAPTYYPGTSRPDEAQSILVDVGQQVTGVTLALVSTPTFQITGAVRSANGGSFVTNALTLTDPSALIPVADANAQTRADGSFSIQRVAPGNYVLNVRATAFKDGAVDGEEFAAVALTVTDADLAGVDIVTGKGATLKGEVAFEAGIVQPAEAARLTVLAVPVSGDIGLGAISAAHVKDDWSFELRGVIGTRLFSLQGLPAGWELKNVELNGTDIIDTPTSLNGTDQRSQLRLIATNRLTELSGSVVGPDVGPVADYTVLVFADDSQKWSLPFRNIRVARTGPGGRFSLRGLPPGRYLAVATAHLPPETAQDPQFLESLRSEATQLSLGAAESKSLQLTLSVRR